MASYIGSVRFFRHLIITTIVLVITGLAAGVCVMVFKNQRLASDLAYQREEVNRLLAAGTPEPVPPAAPEPGGSAKPDGDTEPDGENGGADDAAPAALGEEDIVLLPYQEEYPELYCDEPFSFDEVRDKVIYLTIDDGPSSLTTQFLNMLDRYDVKATFFVIGRNVKGNEAVLRRIAEDGHALGIHSFSHEFNQIYGSVGDFLDDFAEACRIVEEATGVMPTIFRFPGGSVNDFNKTTYMEIIAEMLRRGFVYYDWNISAGDASNTATERSITENVLFNYKYYEHGIILTHERGVTLYALDTVIPEIQRAGYTFDVINRSVKPVTFAYRR